MEVQLRKLVTCPGEVRIEGGHSAAPWLFGAAMVGTAGEIEHASALIYTLRFGNYFRRTLGASISGRPHLCLGERGSIHG